ncbi:MAG: hypothetical protein U9P90_01895 [Patescibacteria group bacterium]|nr:hypothetical protein [Patescibacteria group bacterium]
MSVFFAYLTINYILEKDAERRERYLKTSKDKSTLKIMLRDSLKNA